MADPILQITDGTITVDLIASKSGYHLLDWTPVMPEVKNGGVFQSSPFVDGHRLAFRRFDNAIETFNLKLSGHDMDAAITQLQDLRRLLEKAVSYWTTGWQSEMVWIKARGSCETNTRYAIIHDYRFVSDDNPFAQPFFGKSNISIVDELTLILERGHWLHLPPGEGECVQISSQQGWNPAYSDALLNGSFETPGGGGADVFANWTEVTPAGTQVLDEIADVYLGSHACKLKLKDVVGDGASVAQTVVVAASTLYELAFYTHGNNLSAGYYSVYDNTNGAYIIPKTTTGLNGSIYMPFSTIFTTPAGCISVIVTFYGGELAETPGTILTYFDYARLLRIGGSYTMGRAATCNADEVFVANKWNVAQLTDIYYYDASVVAFSTNLMDVALPYAFLPPVPAAGDIVYFGIATTAGNSGPFCSLVFDIGTAQVDLTTIVWEYYNGAWVTLTVKDHTSTTDPFDTTGVKSVHWQQPTDWTTVAINGITAYWVRARVTVIGAAPAPPSQQNRDIYTVVLPYVEVDDGQVPGDIPALASVWLENVSSSPNEPAVSTFAVYQLYLSTRSVSRGEYFTGFINISDVQNFPDITVTLGASTAFITNVDSGSSTGRVARYNPAGVDALAVRATITPAVQIAYNYLGAFRLFVRGRVTAGGLSNDFSVQVKLLIGDTTVYTSEEKYIDSGGIFAVDFGSIDIARYYKLHGAGYDVNGFDLQILVSNSNAAPGDLYLYDLVMIPTDEFFACFTTTSDLFGWWTTGEHRNLIVDSINVPDESVIALLRSEVNNRIIAEWKKFAVSPFVLQSNARQRVFFFSLGSPDSLIGEHWGYIETCFSIKSMEKSQRYLTMRGDR